MVGSGAGVSIQPVGFLVVMKDNVKLLPVSHCSLSDKIVDSIPDIIDKVKDFMDSKCENKVTYTFTDNDYTNNDYE